MLTTSEQRGELERLFILLRDADVAVVARPVVVRRLGRGVERVTWLPSGEESGDLYRAPYPSIDDYREWIRAEAYSAVLFDGALLQLSFDFAGKEMIGHRLVYCPCPFGIDPGLLNEEPILDVVDLYIDNAGERPRLVSPLRFDFDAEGARVGHPVSHLTTNSASCRWAVSSPLSSGHFIRFVFSHFYPELYGLHEFIRRWPERYGNRTITELEQELLHVACGRQTSSAGRQMVMQPEPARRGRKRSR